MMTGTERDYEKTAVGAINDTPICAHTSAKRLIKVIKRDTETIRRAYAASLKNEERGSLSGAYEWLADNCPAVIYECTQAKTELGRFGRVLASGDSLPYIYSCTVKYLKRVGLGLTDSCDALSENLARLEDFSYLDYFSMPCLFKCAVISVFAEYCALLLRDGEKNTFAVAFSNLVADLKFLSYKNFEGCLQSFPAEIALMRDPSEDYPFCDDKTKNYYRTSLILLAKKRGKTETETANDALLSARSSCGRARHIGAHIIEKERGGTIYLLLFFFLSVALTLIPALLLGPIFAIVFFPISECVKQFLDALFGKIVKTRPTFRKELSEIPEKSAVLIVITCLLCGRDDELFRRLEKIYNGNGGKNIYFGLLADLCDSDTATGASDGGIVEDAERRIELLNSKYGDKFLLFTRHRVYSKSERKFIAWERKRGAVIELVRLLKGEKTTFNTESRAFSEIYAKMPEIKYVITLDSDTDLPLDTAKKMCGAMMHPLNVPVIDHEKKIVVKGHGIMQPHVSPSLDSASKTPFARLICGEGGIDVYSGARYDTYQSLFGQGVFCGKGIFDKDAFYECIDKAFPEEKILSHDILEGARLRCAVTDGAGFTDGCPKSTVAYRKREHRWIRGDIQNLPFIFDKGIGPLSKFQLFDNVRRETSVIFSALGIILASFFDKTTAFTLVAISLLPIFFPFFLDLFRAVANINIQSAARRFFSKGLMGGIWQSLLRSLFFTCSQVKNALMTFEAVCLSLWRICVSGRHTLQWMTAAQADVYFKNSIFDYIRKDIISSVVGFCLFAFSPYGAIKLLGLFFFLLPPVSFVISRESAKKEKVSEKDLMKLNAYAYDIWRFFEDNVTKEDSYLPPDNISFFPTKAKAQRTSPTNIGLYLVSLLAARDFGFIDTKDMKTRLFDTFDTLARMKKYRGHLYNWYDTRDLAILYPEYISTVDSGNFIASLITLKEGLLDYVNEDAELLTIRDRAEKMIAETDFSFLYDTERELFMLGASFENGQICKSPIYYDTYMSEARIASYILCAKRAVPKKHWERLSRMLITNKGHIGLASYSGTAFEYFMPALFLPTHQSSKTHEAFIFTLAAQRRRRAGGKRGVWGISESGFFSFDADMNYGYRAFGIPELGQKRGLEKDLVISPYSSFLAMCVSIKKPLVNLQRLFDLGMYGKYGFYEAIDFTDGRTGKNGEIVKSYMSHHLGMSLISLVNASRGNIMVKRFMHDGQMSAAEELLCEKVPVNAVVKKTKEKKEKKRAEKSASVCERSGKVDISDPDVCALSSGELTCIGTASGHILLEKRGICANHCSKAKDSPARSLFAFAYIDGKAVSPCAISQSGGEYLFSQNGGEFSHTHKTDGVELTSKVTLDGDVCRFLLSVFPNVERELALCFAFEPQLCSDAEYDSNPAFARLFIENEYDAEEKILYFSRRSRSGDEICAVCAVALSDRDAVFEFEKDAARLSLSGNAASYVGIFEHSLSSLSGASSIPFCAVKTYAAGGAELLICLSGSKECAKRSIMTARKSSFNAASHALGGSFLSLAALSNVTGEILGKYEKRLLSAFFFEKRDSKYDVSCVDRGHLYEKGINENTKLISLVLGTEQLCDVLEKYLRAYKLLRLLHICPTLAIIYGENEKYLRTTEAKIREVMEASMTGIYFENENGILTVERNDRAAKSILYASRAVFGIYSDSFTEKERDTRRLPTVFCRKAGKSSFEFLEKGFVTENPASLILPYSHIICGRNIQSVVDTRSLGYTFVKNASEQRLTAFDPDILSSEKSERLLYNDGKAKYDLIGFSKKISYLENCAEYCGSVAGIDFEIKVRCAEKHKIKIISCTLCGKLDGASLEYFLTPVMGRLQTGQVKMNAGEFLTFSDPFSDFSQTGFVFGKSENAAFSVSDSNVARFILSGDKFYGTFFLGAYKSDRERQALTSFMENYNDTASPPAVFPSLPKIRCDFQNADCIKRLMNFWLPYQNNVCRMTARSGYYQSGGAYGFRDQLQDCMCAMYGDKKAARVHIIRAAHRQFPEGDVLHWWHEGAKRCGIRTKCSDDYLWLPLTVCEYIFFTNDTSLLFQKVGYVTSLPLSEYENERFGIFEDSTLCESVYLHCKRAIDRGLSQRSNRGLSLFGSCDWCDGYDKVDGESVFTTMFLKIVCERFANIARTANDFEYAKKLERESLSLEESLEKYAYDEEGGQYMRGFFKNGKPLGKSCDDECSIDLLSCAFAVFARLDKERCVSTLFRAKEKLFDKEHGIMKLVSPPVVKLSPSPGYIKGYVAGMRENGGQYTHAAVWAAMAYTDMAKRLFASENDEDQKVAYEFLDFSSRLFLLISPAYRAEDDALKKIYHGEPYVLAGDVYSSRGLEGRAGWTWYTGSAGWYYRAVLSKLFRVRFSDMENKPKMTFDISFPFPHFLVGACLSVSFVGNYTVRYKLSQRPYILLDGKEHKGYFELCAGKHEIILGIRAV